MSKEQAAAKAKEPAKTVDIDTSGWDDANINIDAWYAPETTGRLVGRVLEAIRVQSEYGEQDVVKVKSATSIKALRGKGEQAETVELPAGSVVAVRVSVNLVILLELVEHQCAVEIVPVEKVTLKGGKRKMWRYSVKFKGTRAMLAKPKTQTNEGQGDPESLDNLPF